MWTGLPDDRSNIFGFVYIIECIHPDIINNDTKKKYYIGCKQCQRKIRRKPLKGKKRHRIDYVDNGVDKYWGSSNELLADIEKYGQEHFTRTVLHLCESKWDAKFMEMVEQVRRNVLFDIQYYNGIVNLRIGKCPAKLVDKYKDFKI